MLGHLLATKVMEAVNYDFEHTVYSYIPNTAAVAFYGMMDGIHEELNKWKANQNQKLKGDFSTEKIKQILDVLPKKRASSHKRCKA